MIALRMLNASVQRLSEAIDGYKAMPQYKKRSQRIVARLKGVLGTSDMPEWVLLESKPTFWYLKADHSKLSKHECMCLDMAGVPKGLDGNYLLGFKDK